MHWTLRQWQVFAAVAEAESYTRAAERLHLSQPAVSMQVRQLEERIGLALFEQHGRQIHLTEAGKVMLGYGQRLALVLDEAREAVEQLKGLDRGNLSISVVSTASEFATRLLAAFAAEHPGIDLQLNVVNRSELRAQLAVNQPDLAITGLPPEGLELESEVFMDNPLVAITAASHPLASQPQIPLARLAAEPFVLREPGSGTRQSVERFFAARALKLRVAIALSDHTAIKQAVAAGLGVAIVSRHSLRLELAAGELRVLDVAELPILRQWRVAHLRGKHLSPAALAFKAFLLADARRFVDWR
jgi:DNA-binding transcriptional LysR family regulator